MKVKLVAAILAQVADQDLKAEDLDLVSTIFEGLCDKFGQLDTILSYFGASFVPLFLGEIGLFKVTEVAQTNTIFVTFAKIGRIFDENIGSNCL